MLRHHARLREHSGDAPHVLELAGIEEVREAASISDDEPRLFGNGEGLGLRSGRLGGLFGVSVMVFSLNVRPAFAAH